MHGVMKSLMAATVALLLSLSAISVTAQEATGEDVPKMTKEELKAKLGNPDVIILDVRVEDQWQTSDQKIPGALHEDPAQDATAWLHKYSKDKTVVLY